MDNNDNGQAHVTDDQELAQVLAGMNQQIAEQPTGTQPMANNMQFEETSSAPTTAAATDVTADAASATQAVEAIVQTIPTIPDPSPTAAPTPEPPLALVSTPDPSPVIVPASPVDHAHSAATPELEAIKKDALEQLRPLVDKLDLPAQEKFDTLLLIIRSTDDQSLVRAANEAAKSIEDESKRAEALLDVIKEIDFFSHPTAQ